MEWGDPGKRSVYKKGKGSQNLGFASQNGSQNLGNVRGDMRTLNTFLMTAIFVPDEACSNDRLKRILLGEPGSALCYINQKRCALGEVAYKHEEKGSTKRQCILPPGIE